MMVPFWVLPLFVFFALVVIWWIGNMANNSRKVLEAAVERYREDLRSMQIDRESRLIPPKEMLPDYIPFDDHSGGIYRMPDGSWSARHVGDRQPNGRADTSTATSVEGAYPLSMELDEE